MLDSKAISEAMQYIVNLPDAVFEIRKSINHPSMLNTTPVPLHLYRRWVQHDSDRCAEGLWWEVLSELSTNNTGVSCYKLVSIPLYSRFSIRRTVWAGDLAPDDSDLRATDLLGCAVNESDLLSEVEATFH